MFKMTKDQMLSAPMDDDVFADWYVEEFMRGELTDFYTDLGPNVCRTFSLNGRRYAEHFGIRRPDRQGQFITLMWILAPNFWQVPAFREVLEDLSLDEEAKVDALHDVPETAAQQATAGTDSNYWYPELFEDNILGVPYVGISDDEVDELLNEIRGRH